MSAWPELAVALHEEANPFDSDALYLDGRSREEILEQLLPHIQQAIAFGKDLHLSHSQQEHLSNVLELLPMGIAVVDAELSILSMNNVAKNSLVNNQLLSIHGSKFKINNREKHKAFYQCVDESLENGTSHTLVLSGVTDGHRVSLMLFPSEPRDDSRDEIAEKKRAVTLFISNSALNRLVSTETLSELYGLSKAEAGLTRHLIAGRSLAEIAELNDVSEATARTQLKSVFRKTDTNRQAELVSLILTGLAPLRRITTSPEPLSGSSAPLPEQVQYLTLRDGRTMSYAQYGDPKGKPVVWVHSARGSRLELPCETDDLIRRGLRLIIPDRSGYGFSDATTDRMANIVTSDIAELADHLCIDQFALLGFSIGGFYALHCAALMPDRVESLSLISALGTSEIINGTTPLKGMFRMVIGLADYAPRLAKHLLDLMSRDLIKDPEKHLEGFIIKTSPADATVFASAIHRTRYIRSLWESCREGSQGYVLDLQGVARSPDIDLSALAMPVSIWHGDQDGHVPVAQARILAERLPLSRINILPGRGHFFIYEEWEEVMNGFSKLHGHPP